MYPTHDNLVMLSPPKGALERYFSKFRRNAIGNGQTFESPFGLKKIIYADWTASGRAYRPIEECLQKEILPFVANTHTEATVTGSLMSKAYEKAKDIVKHHVNAGQDDVLIFCGSGMTGAVNKLQRILGLKAPGTPLKPVGTPLENALKPIVFVTHMEHHSNHISWLETSADVEIIGADENGNVDMVSLTSLLEKFKHRETKIAAITACSNVTGIQTPRHAIAKIMHQCGGLCFVDFACSAPYVKMDMHPDANGEHLDAIYFSPHKFLGGPGTPGVLIFNNKLYKNHVPDQPGGGTVVYSNPWKVHEYVANIEQREDGGTPPFLQGIKAAMCIKLKEAMGVDNMQKREEEQLELIFDRFSQMRNVEVLEGDIKHRLGVVSFIVKGAHHNLIANILNDRFGVQTRAGCSCAGTYGHALLKVDEARSHQILNAIRAGDLFGKPGWVRLSIHAIMTEAEIDFIMDAIELTAIHFAEWATDYTYNSEANEFFFKGVDDNECSKVEEWFDVAGWV